MFKLIKEVRLMNHRIRKMPYIDPDKRRLRLFYVRYADDWIILTNTNYFIANKLKKSIGEFLKEKLKATLSEKKTLITDIRIEPAHFLGFEIRRAPLGRLVLINGKLTRAPGLPIIVSPDKQRIINRLYARGFCNKKGFPTCIPWISNFETHVIIERYNASMTGLMQYYAGWVHHRSAIRRWIYIMRFSCLKTLARKYRSTISKIFKRFGTDLYQKSTATIQATINLKIGDVTYEKHWKMQTYESLSRKYNTRARYQKLLNIFNSREKGEIGEYTLNATVPVVTHENFLEAITWVSMRTQTLFEMPCSICGSFKDVEMHHIKHVRKNSYRSLKELTFLQVLALRNRKSIPVCRHCYIHVIHKGQYSGTALNKLLNSTKLLADNRILHVESFVKPGPEHHSKSLVEKGWKKKYNLIPQFILDDIVDY
jgi:hypothetical protein